MALLNGLINSNALRVYVETARRPINTIASALFPVEHKIGIEMAMLKGSKGINPSLAPSAFDAKATLRSRSGIAISKTKMPFFKEGVRFNEEDLLNLNMLGEVNSALKEDIVRRYYDDVGDLTEAAELVKERMVYQLLFPEDGIPGIAFAAENGVNYTYAYADNAWKTGHYTALAGTSLWTDTANADPLGDINAVKTKLRMNNGSVIRYLIMNSNTLGLMAKCDAIKNAFISIVGVAPNMVLLDEQVRDVIERTTGCIVIVMDDYYRAEDGTLAQYAPDGYISFIPDGRLGTTFRGTTPAESDLIGKNDVDVSIVNEGVALAVVHTVDPVNINTIASQIILPSFDRIDEVGLLKVIA